MKTEHKSRQQTKAERAAWYDRQTELRRKAARAKQGTVVKPAKPRRVRKTHDEAGRRLGLGNLKAKGAFGVSRQRQAGSEDLWPNKYWSRAKLERAGYAKVRILEDGKRRTVLVDLPGWRNGKRLAAA